MMLHETSKKRSKNLEKFYGALIAIKSTLAEAKRAVSSFEYFAHKIRNRLGDGTFNAPYFCISITINNHAMFRLYVNTLLVVLIPKNLGIMRKNAGIPSPEISTPTVAVHFTTYQCALMHASVLKKVLKTLLQQLAAVVILTLKCIQ